MEHLYLMDDDNFLYEHMANLRPGVVDLIQRNVCAMIDAGRKIHVQSADAVPNEEFEQRIKYTEDPGLWDKLINEYNAKHPDKILERWTSKTCLKQQLEDILHISVAYKNRMGDSHPVF